MLLQVVQDWRNSAVQQVELKDFPQFLLTMTKREFTVSESFSLTSLKYS